MPRKRLTDKVTANAKPPFSGRLEYWDKILPGFGLRITDKDARTFFIMYRIDTPSGRVQRRLKIGDAKKMKLGPARDAARLALDKVDRGADPAEERKPPTSEPSKRAFEA